VLGALAVTPGDFAARTGASWRMGTSTALSGFYVRIAVHGEPGACNAPLEWNAVGVSSGSFDYQVGAVCSAASTPAGVAEHVWACPGCSFSASAKLSVKLHWSCQSIALEASAVPSDGDVLTMMT
jgi:hypothetical protein